MTEKMFKENMRVDRKTFNYILSVVGPDMVTQDTYMRKALAVDKKLAMALTVKFKYIPEMNLIGFLCNFGGILNRFWLLIVNTKKLDTCMARENQQFKSVLSFL